MQNFDPKALALDVANLLLEVADLRAMITGQRPFNLKDVAEVGEAGLEVAANFIPRLANIEAILAPLIPILPKLQEMFAGEIAGVGETQKLALSGDTAAVIPAEQLGHYENPPLTETDIQGQANSDAGGPAAAAIAEAAASVDHIPGTA